MSEKPTKIQRAAQISGRRMADHSTPFIYNMWYLAAFSTEVNRKLFSRTILGKDLVFYRTLDGTPIAMNNRCGHRSFPLDISTLEGDSIVCGYHGLRYDQTGTCTEIPSQKGKGCNGISIKNYPLVEQGNSIIWIWMGDPELADPKKIPEIPLIGEGWVLSEGYMDLKASYVYMHENLLDLTHLTFIHADTIGTPDFAGADYETEITEDRVYLKRTVVPTTLPPVWAESTKIKSDTACRIVISDFVSPALHIVHASYSDISIPEEKRPLFRIKTAHFPTPSTDRETHYFVLHGRDFSLKDKEMTRFMHDGLMGAFKEDCVALAAHDQVLRKHDGENYYEISLAADTASIAMRKYLKKLSDAEHAAS